MKYYSCSTELDTVIIEAVEYVYDRADSAFNVAIAKLFLCKQLYQVTKIIQHPNDGIRKRNDGIVN